MTALATNPDITSMNTRGVSGYHGVRYAGAFGPLVRSLKIAPTMKITATCSGTDEKLIRLAKEPKNASALTEATAVNTIAPAGTAVRFEPGQSREVRLVAISGKREVYGFRQDVMGRV